MDRHFSLDPWISQDGQFLARHRTPRWKRAFDLLVAGPALVLLSPVILFLAVLVRLTSRGPALYRQPRVGERGRIFTLCKLRSMVDGAERETGPVWASEDDPRQTRLGRVLRRFHLDELTELWHVLRGDMSLVGPRPERPEFVEKLAEQIPGYVNRLAVRPGITGLAQILLPADRSVDDVRRKLSVDLYYIEHQSFGLDLRILAATALRALFVPWRICHRICGIPRVESILPARESPDRGRVAGEPQQVTAADSRC